MTRDPGAPSLRQAWRTHVTEHVATHHAPRHAEDRPCHPITQSYDRPMRSRPSPLKLIRTGAICLSLGAILTVSIAWSTFLLANDWTIAQSAASSHPFSDTPAGYPESLIHMQKTGAESWHWIIPHPHPSTILDQACRVIVANGLPARAFGFEYVSYANETLVDGVPELSWYPCDVGTMQAPSVRPGHGVEQRIPTTPIWRGVVIDVSVFASLSWLVLFAPSTLRAAHRRHRHRCARCGYEAHALDPCPECGTPTSTP